jgi:YtkA-like
VEACLTVSQRWRLTVLLACGLAACVSDSDGPPTEDAHVHDMPDEVEDDFQGCPAGFPSVAPELKTMGGHLAVKVVAAMPEEPERYINDWTVELSSLDGSPAPDAEIVRGQTFMPIHGHDGRVQPQMTALSEPGQFQVDRLNFTMRGPWEVRLWLRSGSVASDYVVFNVCVAK